MREVMLLNNSIFGGYLVFGGEAERPPTPPPSLQTPIFLCVSERGNYLA
jgi:hypothetical protein